jgi:2'-5' RNA ligase
VLHQPVKASHRLFFALTPPVVLARQVANAASWFDDEGMPVAADRLHVTMFILDDRFDMPSSLVDALRGVGAAIAASPIDVVLDRASGGDKSIALRPSRKIAALDALHRQLANRCAAAGIAGRPNYAFSPHMTLGYRHGRPFNAAVAPIAWTARELVLTHSHLGRTRHDRLGNWPLAAPEPQLALFGDEVAA